MLEHQNIKRRGLMLILSAPSGAGKTTLAKMLLEHDQHLHTSISVTTRQKREGEIEGKDYYFIDEEKFEQMVDKKEFIEHVTVHDNKYGTPRIFVEEYMEKGEDLLFEIDWQGGRKLTSMAREDVVSVFILPPSKADLVQRLQKRNKDSSSSISQRLTNADEEMAHWYEYDYTIINRDLEESFNKLSAILRAERLKKARRTGLPEFVNNLINEKL